MLKQSLIPGKLYKFIHKDVYGAPVHCIGEIITKKTNQIFVERADFLAIPFVIKPEFCLYFVGICNVFNNAYSDYNWQMVFLYEKILITVRMSEQQYMILVE